jgi:hypothetical protein
MFSITIEQSIISLALSVSFGVFVHDTHIDKAALYVVTPSQLTQLIADTAKISVHLHTHAERTSLTQALSDVNSSNSHLHARYRERKHLKAKHLSNGGMVTPTTLVLEDV